MLVYSTTVNEVVTHVFDAIAGQVSRKIIKDLNVGDLIGNRIYIRSDYLSPSKSIDSNNNLPRLPGDSFNCTIKYNHSPFGIKWDMTTPGHHLDPRMHRRDNMVTRPIFFDEKNNIQIIERFQPCNVSMDCTFSFRDYVVAFDVVTRLMSTYVAGELLMINDLSYDYKFPTGMIEKLYYIGKVLKLPSGTYSKWLEDCSRGNIVRHVSKRLNKQSAELVVKKNMWQTLTAIDYNPDQAAIKSAGVSPIATTLPFTATVQFSRVNLLYLKYPLVINNQLVPEELVTVDKNEAYGRIIRYLDNPNLALNPLHSESKYLTRKPVRNPWYDDWNIPGNSLHVSRGARPFFIGVFTQDKEAENTTINFETDMDQYKLSDRVLDYFKSEKDNCLDVVNAKYNITVFADNIQVDPSVLSFDGTTLTIPNREYCRREKIHRVLLCNTPAKRDEPYSTWYINNLIFTITTFKE